VGAVFSYSSGTAMILSRLWQDALGDPQEALGWTVFGLRSPAPCECLSLDGEEMEALRDCGTLIGAGDIL